MGGESKTEQKTSQTSQTTPYGPATAPMNSLISNLGGINPNLTGAETGALNGMQANASAGNPFSGQINGVASGLLGGGTDLSPMVNDAYTKYQSALAPTANGDLVNPESNPQLQGYLSTIQNDVANRVNGMFAGAGRDFSGAHMGTLSRGIAEGTAPVLYDAYNQARGQQLGAQDKMYGAGGQTAGLLSGLQQSKFGNQIAGIGAAGDALKSNDSPFMQTLAIEAQRRGIPTDAIKGLLGPLAGIAAAFGQNNASGTQSGTQQMSGAQQFATIAQGLGSLFGGGKTGQPVPMPGG